MKTKFSIKAFLPLVCSIGLAIISLLIVMAPMKPPLYFLLGYLVFALVWLIFGEIRKKIIKVHFFPNQYILVKRFFGLYHNIYKINEIEGWRYSLLSSKGQIYEYLYLYQNGKIVIKISEFYHSNYPQVKKYVEQHFKYLGYEKFSYLDEFREIFD